MKAMILAAGFGTRLKPWTDFHPKALAKVGGVPMLKRVIDRLISEGYTEIAINMHHFAGQIKNYVRNNNFIVDIKLSDESDKILDTGGGVLKAASDIFNYEEPFLVHNVDILSDAPLSQIMHLHKISGNDISLVTSNRDSNRKLVFDQNDMLCGWHDVMSDRFRPEGFVKQCDMHESAFSGIYVIGPKAFKFLKLYSLEIESEVFPIMDYFLWALNNINIGEIKFSNLNLIDIGKPETLDMADSLFQA